MTEQRPKFDTLFADPRHYRADCRLMRAAIRRGWLDDAPQADRDALMMRFTEANREREATGFTSDMQQARVIHAQASVLLECVGKPIRELTRALRYCWVGDPDNAAGQTTGRPRERWHVAEHPNRIDANTIRRRAIAAGTDLRELNAIIVERNGRSGVVRDRIALEVVEDVRYGWRVWLLCPRCGRRRLHLYPVRAGMRCRVCAGLRYGDRR